MSDTMHELTRIVMSASRKGIFRSTPVFRAYAKVTPQEWSRLEEVLAVPVPAALRDWLLTAGFGDINDQLSFRADWMVRVDTGQLKGGVQFAQDDLGNFYACDSTGRIYFLSRSEPVFALMANDFPTFLQELVRRDYELQHWTDVLETHPYDW